MHMKTLRLKIERIIYLIKKYRLFIKFLLIGGSNTFISFMLFVFFIKVLGEEHYQLSLLASWCFSSIISFALQKTVVFKTKGNWLKEYVRCLITWAIGYCINAVALAVAVHWLVLHVILGQLLALSLAAISTFFLFKYFAFNIMNKEA